MIAMATSRKVYQREKVIAAWEALEGAGAEALGKLYRSMVDGSEERFVVKPSQMGQLDRLREQMPNFEEPIREIQRQAALAASSSDDLEIMPMLLLGDPGIGKTKFAREVASILSTGFALCPMSSMTAGWILSGASSQWKSAKPGKVFDTIIKGEYANPVMLLDEIDKASGSSSGYDPLGALYSLLERDTAREFVDEFAEVPIDASGVVWIGSANEEESVPRPLLSRMNVFVIKSPDQDELRRVAQSIYEEIRSSKEWGRRFDPSLSEAALEKLMRFTPREMRKAIMSAFGSAHLDGRAVIESRDIPEPSEGARRSIGF